MKKIRSDEGFTILEVMVALIILSVSLLMLLHMAMIAIDGNDWSNQATRSTQLLQGFPISPPFSQHEHDEDQRQGEDGYVEP